MRTEWYGSADYGPDDDGQLSLAMTCIVTLRLDEASQEHFERLRQLHFPAARNLIPAHLTLFHRLPDVLEVRTALAEVAGWEPAFPVDVTGVRSLGYGVAYTLTSPVLQRVHGELAAVFESWLSAQDRQRFAPHIVVQNKATAEAARVLLGELRQGFQPMRVKACGLDLWEYLGGPWRWLETFQFVGS